MKKIFLLFVLSFSCGIVYSQESSDERRAKAMEDPKFKEFKQRHEDLVKQRSGIASSEYYGYDETLKSFFSGNIIPSDTPKSKATQSKEQYVQALNLWISNNKQYLKPEHKNSLIKE